MILVSFKFISQNFSNNILKTKFNNKEASL